MIAGFEEENLSSKSRDLGYKKATGYNMLWHRRGRGLTGGWLGTISLVDTISLACRDETVERCLPANGGKDSFLNHSRPTNPHSQKVQIPIPSSYPSPPP